MNRAAEHDTLSQIVPNHTHDKHPVHDTKSDFQSFKVKYVNNVIHLKLKDLLKIVNGYTFNCISVTVYQSYIIGYILAVSRFWSVINSRFSHQRKYV